jgi:hypothetical protein
MIVNLNFRLLLSYCGEPGNTFSDDRPHTPTLNDPNGERNSKRIERLKLLESKTDGLSGIQEYLDSNTRYSENVPFALLFLNSIKKDETLNMYFISWDKYLDYQNTDLMQHHELMNAQLTSTNFSFNIFDLEDYFPDLPITFYYKSYYSIRDFTETTEANLRSSATFYPRKARKVLKVYDEDIIDQDGSVDEWLAFDNG